MCKLFCILDIENADNALEFAEKAVKPLTAKDNDGLGVIMLGDQGLGVERWLKPSDFPTAQTPISPALSKYADLIPAKYNSYGATTQQNIYAIGIHARMATGAKTLENVHPFVKNNVALIHNGVISNHEKWEKELSSCDSEALLSLYLDNHISKAFKKIRIIESEAVGWYAFMVFNENTKSVDIMKDDTTSLYFAHVPTVGIVFCTTWEIIKSCVGQMHLKQPEIHTFPASTAMRWTHGKDKIETLLIEPEVYQVPASRQVYLTDDTKCDHGCYPKRWCPNCKLEDKQGLAEDRDFPSHLQDHR
jgi:hypothetical protein